ncbi:histidine ammonia-lyase [Cellulomonas fimi]|uniref:histidine ammonia-lyase n=1 Tax=Cellulomonas fimi TaxID=1708 RepID=UPI002359628C|nr:histidine ammonia-lyase [Cellulomonas fimi]
MSTVVEPSPDPAPSPRADGPAPSASSADRTRDDRASHPHGAARRTVVVGVGPVPARDVVAVARDGAGVALAPEALAAITAGRAVVDALADDDEPHYGVSTGFGALATRWIPADRRADLQRSLIRSHAAGTGAEVEREVVRALMLLRLSTLATGRTGVRPSTAQAYAAMLDAGITPVVREFGSLGCSGDLAPLAHVALALMGEGEVRDPSGALVPAADALARTGLAPVVLAEKEGLALVNGTDGMLGQLVLALHDLDRLLATADVAAALSVESLLGTDAVLADDLHTLRPHPGQAASARHVRALLRGSGIMASHRGPGCTRVQDAYSLRCAPQVHGAARDTVEHARAVAERELAAAIDNPVVTVDGRVESNGNFHGAPVGYVLDFLAIAVADVASMSERRTDRFLDVARNNGLPAFLAHDPGVDSGLMIAQYTAAGLVSELKRLAVPASVDSIPSSAMQEDHVSMGWHAARKLRRAVDALGRVLAIEVLTATRALDLRAPLAPAPATGAVRDLLRTRGVAGPGPDAHLSPDLETVAALVASGEVLAAADAVTSPEETR